VIDLISDDELGEALKLVLTQHAPISEKELFARTYRLFGFNNIGTKIRNRLKAVLKRLDNLEEIECHSDGTVSPFNKR